MKKVCGNCQVKGVDRCLFWEGGGEGGWGGGGVRFFGIWRADELRAVIMSCKSRTVILYPCVLGIPIPDLPTPKPCKSGVFEKTPSKNLDIGTSNLEVYKI